MSLSKLEQLQMVVAKMSRELAKLVEGDQTSKVRFEVDVSQGRVRTPVMETRKAL